MAINGTKMYRQLRRGSKKFRWKCARKKESCLICNYLMSQKAKRIQQERLAMFHNRPGYEELHRDDFWYIKHWNGKTQKWQVDRFTEESYARYKGASNPKPHKIELGTWRCCLC